jgi:hypothetical protein
MKEPVPASLLQEGNALLLSDIESPNWLRGVTAL